MAKVVENEVKNNVDLRSAYGKFMDDFKGLFYEREWEIAQLKFALLIKEHVLLKGIPGTAKSLLAKKVFAGIEGAKVYSNQFTRFQDEATVFGPQLLDEFKKGKIIHNTDGSLVSANFGFLDEFFNASEELLVSTLEVLNERTFTRPHQKEDSPLCTAVLTTNQEREDEKELRAVYDRILFKSGVQELAEAGNRLSLYRDFIEGKMNTQPKFEFVKLLRLQKEFKDFTFIFSDRMLLAYDSIMVEFAAQSGMFISPRKKNLMLKIVIANAFLRGAERVEIEDISAVKYALVEGGDGKAATYFDSVLNKVQIVLADSEVVEQLEKLFVAIRDGKKDVKDKHKAYTGIVGKCKDKIDKLVNESSGLPLVSMLSKLKDSCEKEIKRMESVKNGDIF